jgi:hypothetical protein
LGKGHILPIKNDEEPFFLVREPLFGAKRTPKTAPAATPAKTPKNTFPEFMSDYEIMKLNYKKMHTKLLLIPKE